MLVTHRRLVFAGSSALAVILLVPVCALAQMRGRQMPSMGRTGMKGMSSMGRSGSLSGSGSGFSGMMSRMSAGRSGSLGGSQGQGGSRPQGGSGGGYGSSTSQMTSQPYGAGAYDVANYPLASSPPKAEADPFVALRGHPRGLAWPVALRYLTRDSVWKETRERIDAQVDQLAPAKAGKVSSAALLPAVQDDVAKLRRHFYSQGDDMPVSRQQEADARRFLDRLRDVLDHFPNRATSASY